MDWVKSTSAALDAAWSITVPLPLRTGAETVVMTASPA